jgi:hypothetical protein
MRPLPILALLALAGAPALAAPLSDPALESFLRSAAHDAQPRFEQSAERVNPYQIPLLALVLNADERANGPRRDAYEALVRWHFWLAQQLDTQGKGMWTLRRFGASASRQSSRRDSALLAALQRQELRALAEMAVRRGRMVDALAWWREESLVERRMIARLYDPVLGGYADVDSLGTRIAGSADLRSLIAVGLGAPTLPDSGAELARRLLLPQGESAALRDQLALLLDPSNGWWNKPGAAEIGLKPSIFFLRRALGRLREQNLARELEAVAGVYGLKARTASLLLGSLELSFDDATLAMPAFPRSEAALAFLMRARLVDGARANALLGRIAALRRGECSADSVSAPLLAALVEWRKQELEPIHQGFLREGETLPPPPNGEGAGAFRYAASDQRLWANEALMALMQDILGKHLSPQGTASYEAIAAPRALPIGGAAELTLRRDALDARMPWPSEGWRAAWSDGNTVRPSTPLHLVEIDAQSARASLPSPPGETGMWWLVLTGPLGGPRDVTGLSVVEPLRVELSPDGRPAVTGQDLRIVLENNTLASLRGRVDLEAPPLWQVSPSSSLSFDVASDRSAVLKVTLRPEFEVAPGQYSLGVRVSGGNRVYAEFRHELAVPYEWISLGPFAIDREQQLATRVAGDEVLDLAGKYQGIDGNVYWEHLPETAIEPEGWIRHVDEAQPRGLRILRTVLSSTSREVLVALESRTPAEVRINGRSVVRSDGSDGVRESETVLDFGANHIVVRTLAGGGSEGRFRLALRDIEGGPLRTVDNRLERLLDGYALVRGAGAGDQAPVDRFQLVPITYHGKGIQNVSVVGSFNGWSPSATPMRQEADGVWKAEVRLPHGRFEYKLAIDGVRWIADPGNPLSMPDGFGGKNSLLVLQ